VLEESAEIADRLGLQFGAMYKQQARDRREQFVFRSLYEHIVDGFGAGGLHRFGRGTSKGKDQNQGELSGDDLGEIGSAAHTPEDEPAADGHDESEKEQDECGRTRSDHPRVSAMEGVLVDIDLTGG
jgi:hypothetical protein